MAKKELKDFTVTEALDCMLQLEEQRKALQARRAAFLDKNEAVFAAERQLAGAVHDVTDALTALHRAHPRLGAVAAAMAPESTHTLVAEPGGSGVSA